MKKFCAMTLAFVLGGIVLEAHAQDAEDMAYCAEVSSLAESMMDHRQKGTGMAKMMEVAGELLLAREMVIMAFEQPAFSTPDYQRKAVRQFADEWYLACVQHRRQK